MVALRRGRVGSRTSPLSVAQTEEVISTLRARFPESDFVVVPIETGGDKNKDAPLQSLDRGTFVKEIELALLAGQIDIAVHSAKDLTATLPDGLTLGGVVPRLDPRDVQVNRWHLPLSELPSDARLGTSSPRRVAQLKALRPDIQVLPIRGNVGTRLDKARGDDYDGVVLAAAGLLRLARQAEITEYLSPDEFTPEVGQGALAVQARTGDTKVLDMLAAIDHPPSSFALRVERAFLAEIGGGCNVPVAAYAKPDGDGFDVSAMAAVPDGSRIFRTRRRVEREEAEQAGKRTARALLDSGASEIV